MISKHTRKTTGSVENLKQGGFTVVKGIDATASPLSTDTAAFLKNLDIDTDGGLILRKPLICVANIPEVIRTIQLAENTVFTEIIPTEVIFVGRVFDKKHLLCVREDGAGNQYLGIFDSDKNPVSLRMCWDSWEDYSTHYTDIEFTDLNFFSIPFFNFSKGSFVNTATSTVCTGVSVNLLSDVFKREGVGYFENSTDLCYTALYDIPETSGTLYKYRTLVLNKSTAFDKAFDLNIVTPDVNNVQTSEELLLNPNLDLDNPYAIRDVYNTSAPVIKSILPYVPAVSINKRIEPAFTESVKSDTCTQSKPYENKGYVSKVPDIKSNLTKNNVSITAYGTYSSDTRLVDLNYQYDTSNLKIYRSICGISFSLGCNLWVGGYDNHGDFKKAVCFAVGDASTEGGLFEAPVQYDHGFIDVDIDTGVLQQLCTSSTVSFKWKTIPHPHNFSESFLNSLTNKLFADLLHAWFRDGTVDVTDIMSYHNISYYGISSWKIMDGKDTSRETYFQQMLSVTYPEHSEGVYSKKSKTLYSATWR